MFGFLLGSTYGVSAGLIVYGIERDYIAQGSALTYLIAWAVVGLVLAFSGIVVRTRS